MPRPHRRRQRLEARRRRLERHAAEDDPAVVLNAAARFLEVRSRSVDEVRRHLTAARYPADAGRAGRRAPARAGHAGRPSLRAAPGSNRATGPGRAASRPCGASWPSRAWTARLIAEILAERAARRGSGDGSARCGRLAEPGAAAA